MAGDWIKWTKGLAARREVAVLAARMDRDRHEIAGRLMVLWEWCDDNMTESDVETGSFNVSLKLGDKPFAFVDALLGLPGMAEAMASPEVRWLEARSGGRLVFPNLARHNGTSAKTRAYEQRKKAGQRAKVSPKFGDKTGTREEKRREDSKDKDPPSPPLEFPPQLDTVGFRNRWAEWEQYRREIKHPLALTTAKSQLKRLAKEGETAAAQRIERSIANGWRGLWFSDDNGKPRRPTGNGRPDPAAKILTQAHEAANRELPHE